MVERHAEFAQLKNRLTRCARFAAPWAGVVFRSASVAYANRDDLLTGMGARQAGARWNPPNSMATVYTSLEIATATEEALAHHRYFGFAVETALPRVLVSVRVSLQRVLNLTDTQCCRPLGASRRQFVAEDWRAANADGREALTQALGSLAWEEGWEGLLVPSAARQAGSNLIIFPGNLLPQESYLLIVNRDQLPPRMPAY